MTTRPSTTRAGRLLATITAGALALGMLAALDASSTPPVAALGSLGDVSVGNDPYGIDVSPDGSIALVTNTTDGTVTVLDVSGPVTLVDTITVGGQPVGVSFSPDGKEAWVSTWTGNSITVIDVGTLSVIETINAGNGAWSVTFTADGSTAYAVNYTGSSVAVVDTATRAVLRTISGLSLPQYASLSPDESMLFLPSTNADRVTRIDLSDDSITTLPVGDFPVGGVITPAGDELWVTNSSSDSISIIDLATFTVTATIPTGDSPIEIVVAPDGENLLVTHNDGVEVMDVAARTTLGTVPAPNSEAHEVATIPGTGRALVALRNLGVVRVLGFEQERLSGADRYATAVAISQRAFPGTRSTVIVASGANFPDALAAGPAASILDGPLLLTNPAALPTVVRDEIIRLDPDTIYIVGGTGAVSTAVENALKVLQPNTIRVSGANRYATGAAIVDEAWGASTVSEVFIATGRNYPDALSAGAVAAGEGIPVILVDGALGTVPQATIDLITQLAPTQITIAGGTGAVSAGIRNQLDAVFTAEVRRLSGADRYATSAAINLDAYPTNTGLIYATGTGFADALAGSSLAGRAQIPLYLVQPGCVPAAAIDAIWSGETTNLFLLGGTGALSSAVANLTPCT